MRWMLAAAVLATVFVSCGGGDKEISGFTAVEDLRGRTIGVMSLDDISTVELRYVLQDLHGVQAGREDAAVTLVEVPAQELLSQLEEGTLDAAIVPAAGAVSRPQDDAYRVLSHVTKDVRDATGRSVISSLLVTYADLAEQRHDALMELNRLLAESGNYLDANRNVVVNAVAADLEIDSDLARAWWGPFGLRLGDLSAAVMDAIAGTWEIALTVGELEAIPDLESVVFPAAAGEQGGLGAAVDLEQEGEGDRTTISLAVLDDPSRHAALYAIEEGLVGSNMIDLDITYLTPSALTEAASARQFDVVETTPLAVPLGIERGLEFVILSAGVENVDGTLLFVFDR